MELRMDEGIFWVFYVIAEAIRNFFVYTPFKFMLCALLFIGVVMYFFVFWEKERSQWNLKILFLI